MKARLAAVLSLAAIASLAPLAAADGGRGEALLREALDALAKNDPATALEKAKAARPDLPGSPLLANIVADSERMLGHWDEALDAYASGAQGEYGHRAHFNAGVTGHERAEEALKAAGVPLDPAGLPEGPQPELLKAIGENVPHELRARENFLRALDEQPADAAARESIAALNRRLDDLAAMQAELEKRQQEQDKDKDKGKQDDKDQDQKDKEKQDKDKQDSKDKDKQDQQQQQDSKDGDPKDPQDEKDKPKDEQDGDKDKQPGQDGKQDQQQGQPQDGKPSPDKLGKEQIQQIMDQLADLEKEGRQLQKAREMARRQAVEKDW